MSIFDLLVIDRKSISETLIQTLGVYLMGEALCSGHGGEKDP